MKKRVTFFMALAAGAMIMLSSCSKSADALIEDYGKAITEMNSAIQKGDVKKVESLSKKIMKIGEQLDNKDLTPQQESKILEYTSNLDLGGFDYDDFDF